MSDMETDITRVLETLANTQPAAPAIHVPGRATLTYADLGAQIRYVRERLRGWGMMRGDVIAGVIPGRSEMALACAAIPSASTFVPLSPAFKVDAYCELLTRLRPKAIIVPADLGHPAHAAAQRCRVAEVTLTLDPTAPAGTFALDLTRHDESLYRPTTVDPDVAHIISTSGTTGRAKLAPITHRRIALFAQTTGDWLQIAPNDVGCHLAPLHNGHGLNLALMIPLLRGASTVCLPESDVEAFFNALEAYEPTWLTAVFTVHKEILRMAVEYKEAVARSKFRFFRVGSGGLQSQEIDRLEQMFRVPVLNGLTAQEVFSVTHDPLPPAIRKRGSVGLSICNEVEILGEGGAFCRPGEIGEIVVRGPLVFDGYLDDPQGTATSFTDGWCRTGDLGHFDEDGYLFLTGRVKDLIHRGGEKISPLEIDATLEGIAGVRAAAAFGIPHRTLGEEVAAAIVKDGSVAIEASGIIDHMRRRMGPKRVPRQIYFVDQLPRTDSGKIRRSELPRLLGLDQVDLSTLNKPTVEAASPTLSPLESALLGLWSSVLQVNSIGVNDDFFLLGGDSLRGARLLTNVKAVLGVDLPFELLLRDAATVAGMAREIEATRLSNSTLRLE